MLPDWSWALVVGVASLALLALRVGFGENLFFLFGGARVPSGAVWLVAGLLVAQAVPMAWFSRAPVVCFAVIFAAFLAVFVLLGDRAPALSATLLFAVLALCAFTPARTWVPTLVVAVVVEAAVHIWLVAGAGGGTTALVAGAVLAQTPLVYAAPVLAGLLFASQASKAKLAEERAVALVAASEARAARAVDAERGRMSGEVHDIAAHHLSSVLLRTRDATDMLPASLTAPRGLLESVQAETEEALSGLRQLVSLLRDPTGAAPKAPTLTSLPGLVASVRTLYPQVDVVVDGELSDVDPVRSLACYRIVQESLTNARTHAPGAVVQVHVARHGALIDIDVVNGPGEPGTRRRGGGGLGLPAMGERAAVLSGSLEHGPTDDGGWRVHAVIPARPGARP